MKKLVVISICAVLALTSVGSQTAAKNRPADPAERDRVETPAAAYLPPDLIDLSDGAALSSATADTFNLGWWGFGLGVPDQQGWTTHDRNEQLGTFFHIASGSSELNGGTFGTLLPIEGNKSAWCGVSPTILPPFCGYATLPGYGNGWVQYWTFDATSSAATDFSIAYAIQWDSETGYDETVVQYQDNSNAWIDIDAVNGGSGFYDNSGSATESHTVTHSGNVKWRFCFTSDGAWSDEDGLWPTDGAVLVDSITTTIDGTTGVTYTYENELDGATVVVGADGEWNAEIPAGFGDFAALYPGVNVLQEDPCFVNFGFLWGFFDDPLITNYSCHSPDPQPQQGAIRYGPDAEGQYLDNEIRSPLIPFIGAGDEVLFTFLIYRDLPLDNLLFYRWAVRSVVAGCPTSWGDQSFVYYGGGRDWLRATSSIGILIDFSASDIQVALGMIDMCSVWCNVFGSGSCHSHGALYDEVEVKRVNTVGPQYTVRHLDLFQDNFAGDGTTTGTARADAANDIASSSSPTILPGDSVCITAGPVGGDVQSGTGPSAYCYVAVWPPNQPGKTPADIEAPETRPSVGKRWPLVGTQTDANGVVWACFRMDSSLTGAGGIVADRYCIDLNDALFTPCDTICYFFGASDPSDNTLYWTRRLDGQGTANAAGTLITPNFDEAANTPMEFSILPGGGWKRGGNILYVDDADDRGGPVQLYFDTAFEMLGIREQVDRYDVLGPSSNVANSLASRVTNISTQIMACYRTIIWCSGNLSSGTIGDGAGPEKSDDYSLLFTLLNSGFDNPGLYISGDNIAQEWVTLPGAGAIAMRSVYMNFNLLYGDHLVAGEPVSPLLTATGPCFIHFGVPDQLIVYGGCPLINDFDVLETTGLSQTGFPYPNGSGDAVISQATPNAAATTARIMLSGFSYHYIRDDGPSFPPDRVEHLQDILVWLQTGTPVTGIDDDAPIMANALHDNFPNPFNPVTTITYSIKQPAQVSLRVYNVAGQLVRTLVDEQQTPQVENFKVTWNGRNDRGQDVSSGVYFYKLVTKGFSETKKMVLLK